MRKSQTEYNKILDSEKARVRGLSNGDCVEILIAHGCTYDQAKNGAYVYLKHGDHLTTKRRGAGAEYSKILNAFNAERKEPKECISHLEGMGFSYGQAKSAVYQYRLSKGLIT